VAKHANPVDVDNIVRGGILGFDKLALLAKHLKDGNPVPVTVRKLLSWFHAQRRGSLVVWRIRFALKENQLRTDPDFETSYIDGIILISLELQANKVSEEHISEEVAGPTGQATSDPVYRLRMLPSANKKPVSLTPNATVEEAITVMLSNDFSQVPVMPNERDVKGMFSWESYGTKVALGTEVAEVRECMEKAHILSDDASLFSSINEIVQNQSVLVRDSTGVITGIVTASDLSMLFLQLSEPFLLLAEIENQVRRILSERGNFTKEQLETLRESTNGDREVEGISDLAFGDYVRILENPENWEYLQLQVDRKTFVTKLDAVRRIRNEVMHFSPDPPNPEDLESLRKFTAFLQKLQLALPNPEMA
jgi:CBS domain-containing protein